MSDQAKGWLKWDPFLQYPGDELQVGPDDDDGFLGHIRYQLAQGSGHLSVATTRPETMLGGAAVAVHPDGVLVAKLETAYFQHVG